jgi:hypothetical protein
VTKRNGFKLRLLILLALSSCGPTPSEELAQQNIHPITLESGLVCVRLSNHYQAGLSCNWEKYNAAVAACLTEKSKVYYDDEGIPVVFPNVEGYCDKV